MRFLTGLIVGMSLGAAVGLLFAPQAGEETLARIQSRFDAILEEGRKAAEQSRADAQTRLAELKEGKS
jgi:gas vesicle protein